jgi:hypothetical protein
MNDQEFLQFIYDRLKNVYGESENIDYMIRFQGLIKDTFKNTENAHYTMARLIDSVQHYKKHGS